MPWNLYGTAQVVITVTMISLIIFGNGMLCVIILKVRRLRNPSGYLLVNLAVGEILVGVLLLPFSIPAVLHGKWTMGTNTCQFNGFLQHALSAVSVLTVLSVSIDRYFAIVTPLTYRARVTTQKTLIAVCFTWFYALFSACFPFMKWSTYHFVSGLWLCENNYRYSLSFTYFKFLVLYVIPFLVIVYIYACIFKISWHHSRQIRNEIEAFHKREEYIQKENTSTVSSQPIAADGEYCLRKPHSSVKAEIKTALSLGCVVGLVFLAWGPYLFVNLWGYHTEKEVPVTMLSLTSNLYYLSSVLNPYLYGYLNRNVKREFKKMVIRTKKTLVQLGSRAIHPSGAVHPL